jgi:hypothetical protein
VIQQNIPFDFGSAQAPAVHINFAMLAGLPNGLFRLVLGERLSADSPAMYRFAAVMTREDMAEIAKLLSTPLGPPTPIQGN